MAPPNSRSFSVSVVLPASGCEMIAKVRRRATSAASGERGACSVWRARSDMKRACGRENRRDQGDLGGCEPACPVSYRTGKDDLPSIEFPRGRPCLFRKGVVMAWFILFIAGLM